MKLLLYLVVELISRNSYSRCASSVPFHYLVKYKVIIILRKNTLDTVFANAFVKSVRKYNVI